MLQSERSALNRKLPKFREFEIGSSSNFIHAAVANGNRRRYPFRYYCQSRYQNVVNDFILILIIFSFLLVTSAKRPKLDQSVVAPSPAVALKFILDQLFSTVLETNPTVMAPILLQVLPFRKRYFISPVSLILTSYMFLLIFLVAVRGDCGV